MASLPDSLTSTSRAFSVPAGPSILDRLWTKLDESVDNLMELDEQEPVQINEKHMAAGICAGLATAISIMMQPYRDEHGAVLEVKNAAMCRYREREANK